MHDWENFLTSHTSLLWKTKWFHVSTFMFNNGSQKTSKYGKKKHQWHTQLCLMCGFFVLITFYCHLWSTTEYMQDNMKSSFSTGTCSKSLLVTKIWTNTTLCSGNMMRSVGENLPTNFCSKVGGNFRRT